MTTSTKIIAEDTLSIIEKGYYINNKDERVDIAGLLQHAVDNTKLFRPEELEALIVKQNDRFTTEFIVANETTLNAARQLSENGEVLVLNFASAKNPGGGFLGGAVAQEESIARASGLYPCLLKAPEYYHYHRTHRSCLYSDHMIYSPAVPVFKEEDGSNMDKPVTINIITSAAVNAGVVHQNETNNVHLIEPMMRTRIEKLLALCCANKQTTLVLGAWGCGVFRNDPEMIAGLFHEALNGKFASCFERVMFAVKTNKESMIEPFRKRFA